MSVAGKTWQPIDGPLMSCPTCQSTGSMHSSAGTGRQSGRMKIGFVSLNGMVSPTFCHARTIPRSFIARCWGALPERRHSRDTLYA
jgi:hypothetical protein